MTISGDAKMLHQMLFELQGAIPVIPKTSTNPHFKSKYADLPTIMEIVMPIFNKLGLVLLQPIHKSDQPNMLEIETIIIHANSGGMLSTTASIPIGNNLTPQAFGSAITYARRYVLCSLLGIVADEDDDGNASSITVKEAKKATAKPGSPPPAPVKDELKDTISESDAAKLYMIARNAGYNTDEVHNILSKRGIYNAKQLTKENYIKFCNWLEANRKDNGE